jgi:hypothetical protein
MSEQDSRGRNWIMDLPDVLEQLFDREVEQIEQEKQMPYITSVERLAKREARAELLIRALERRFQGSVPESIVARIRSATDLTTFDQWLDLAYASSNLEEFQQKMQS